MTILLDLAGVAEIRQLGRTVRLCALTVQLHTNEEGHAQLLGAHGAGAVEHRGLDPGAPAVHGQGRRHGGESALSDTAG